jgi:hypothetical protein
LRARNKIAIAGAALVLGAGAFLLWLNHARHRYVRADSDLVRQLPPGDATRFFADIATLRQGGMLRLLTGVKPAEEKEYAEFVKETQFDYTRDLDALAGSFDGEQTFFLLRGRFEWGRLRQYAQRRGGVCRNDFCIAPSSKSGYWVSWTRLQPDVAGVAVSANSSAVEALRVEKSSNEQDALPGDPLWLKASRALLMKPDALPSPLRIFAISLQSADTVVFSLRQANDASAAFLVEMQAIFPLEASAETARKQLELETRMIKIELARAHKQPDPSDLSGLVTAGSFRSAGKHVEGSWPVRRELLRTLE